MGKTTGSKASGYSATIGRLELARHRATLLTRHPEQTGHRSPMMLRRYIRRGSLFKQNAASYAFKAGGPKR